MFHSKSSCNNFIIVLWALKRESIHQAVPSHIHCIPGTRQSLYQLQLWPQDSPVVSMLCPPDSRRSRWQWRQEPGRLTSWSTDSWRWRTTGPSSTSEISSNSFCVFFYQLCLQTFLLFSLLFTFPGSWVERRRFVRGRIVAKKNKDENVQLHADQSCQNRRSLHQCQCQDKY